MRVVLDTNVWISGIFWSGPPHRILQAWRDRMIELVVSVGILDEYQRVAQEIARNRPQVDLAPWHHLLAINALLVQDRRLPRQVCTDPDDDKFLACALAAGSGFVITGDKPLLQVNGYRGLAVLTPRAFCSAHLPRR